MNTDRSNRQTTRVALTPEVKLGNVPMDASFSAIGSFPSHQLGNNPIEFFGPSIGTFYRRICQNYDLAGHSNAGFPRARDGPVPLAAKHG
jgi:hypothetical protein